jgi:uncharacterized protein
MPRPISRDTARRFLVKRQLLDPPRSLPPQPESVMQVIERVGSLQFDPLDVAGRNHDLVLAARIGGYRRELTDELLYGSRQLFEAYNKSLNLLPTSELPYYRLSWQWSADGRAGELIAAHRDLADRILGEIRDTGAKSTIDFEREAAIDWWWGPTTAVRAVLEALCVSGVVGLSRRDGNRRYYDLTERLYPAELLERRVTDREAGRHRLLSRYRGHGLLGAGGPGELWVTMGKPGLRHDLRAELIDRGDLVPVSVEGVRAMRYVLPAELPILDAAEAEASVHPVIPNAGVAFVAPLDPLMWDRSLLGPLWSFDYIWEVYTPLAKRRWGYYVLPILFGDRLVGRIEPRLDRKAKVARVLGLSWEPGFDPMAEPGFVDAFADALRAYMAFGGANGLEKSGAVVERTHRALFRAVAATRVGAAGAVKLVPATEPVVAKSVLAAQGMRASASKPQEDATWRSPDEPKSTGRAISLPAKAR